ncbi:hypothetical protein BD408DRAFT_371155 [Parasitella parasitica]|nr:hypothetical protein BD408DRAFT_371155 [Parasitella parasitica]
MPPKTRSLALLRKPVWNSFDWLEEHYEEENGLPGFFSHGAYTLEMREVAEEDYIYTIEQALKCNNEDFSNWAMNMKANKYIPLQLSTTKEYWKTLACEEIQELKQKRLSTTLLSQATYSQSRLPKRQKHLHIAKDLMYLDDLNESVGTIIKSTAKATDIADRKTCYFKT